MKIIGLVIIGILLFVLGFLYGRERVTYYPLRESRVKLGEGGIIKAPLRKVEEKKLELKPAKGFFTLQLGSFEKKEHAEELFQELQKKGYPVFLGKADLGEKGVWYRVKAGEFPTRAEAEKFREKLEKEEGLKESLIIPF